MRTLLAIACLALFTATLAGCAAEDAERYPDGLPTTSASQSQTTSGTGTSTGPAGNGTGGNGTEDVSANVTADPTNGTAPLNVTFTLSGNASEGSLTWAFLYGDGNGTNGTELPATLVHQFLAAGNYTATLTVSDGSSNATASTTITVDGGGGAGGEQPGPNPACQRPGAVGHSAALWVDDRGGGSVWLYEETNGIAGLQLSMDPSPLPAPAGGHTDPLAIQNGCLDGDTMLF